MKLPYWFRQELPDSEKIKKISSLLDNLNLHTVCHKAQCPNIGSCFKENNVTFMILGDRCTRNCRFCAVQKARGETLAVDFFEPLHIAWAVFVLGLDYVVITSVSRDDLVDGGASQFVKTIEEIQKLSAQTKIELLIPDFKSERLSFKAICKARPQIIGHNLETVSRFYKDIRPQANYKRSLELLSWIKEIDYSIYTKSSILLGLGESFKEVKEAMVDLRSVNCDILTLGQYLQPSKSYFPVEEYIALERFEEYKRLGLELGFKVVTSGPLVRSSYKAADTFKELQGAVETCTT